MTDAQRQMYLKWGAFAMGGIALLEYVIIPPISASWTAQGERIDALRKKVDRGQILLDRKDTIQNRWNGMLKANLPTEVSAAENLAFQAIGRWARTGGISFTNLTPQWQDHDEGYQTLECRATATGTQAQLGRFIYEMETDPIPVALEEVELATRDERGAVITMTARFTFLRLNTTARN